MRRERNIDVAEKHPSVASHMHPTKDVALNPGMCPDWESNQQPFSLWDGAQPTEPHWSGLLYCFHPHYIPFSKENFNLFYFCYLNMLDLCTFAHNFSSNLILTPQVNYYYLIQSTFIYRVTIFFLHYSFLHFWDHFSSSWDTSE